MAAKSLDWQPGPTVCRCCLTEGCYKDISTEYFWMGKREVYAEMLSETFDVTISYAQVSSMNSNSRLICEPCISRLRDATDFKRQVLDCERTFHQYLNPQGALVGEASMEQYQERDIKVSAVKVEVDFSGDEMDTSMPFQDDDDDDLDDQPLTKLASKIPKKESVDYTDLEDNAKAVKRKSTSKDKPSPSKKAKKKETAKPTVKPSASKSTAAPKPEKKKKEIYERAQVRRNARLILQCSTAYPFKLPEDAQVCVYCYDRVDDPAMFRKHMNDEHSTFKVGIAFAHLFEGYLKVDITELKCRLCLEQFKTLEQVTEHLNSVHNVGIDVKCELGLQPFILEKSKRDCAICNERFTNLRALSRHTQKHFVKFTCEACGKAYATFTSLRHHIGRNHNVAKYVCRKCKKPFSSTTDLREHMLNSKRCLMHVCNVCGDRFYTWGMKQTHMHEAHGVPEKSYDCQECNAVFTNRNTYRNHFKITHTAEHFACSCCGRRFETKYKLGRHMVTHTGEKQFECDVCSKRFPRKSTLDQHMWIHKEIKKWQCSTCDKQFNQRVSWKTHMKSHHPELCDF